MFQNDEIVSKTTNSIEDTKYFLQIKLKEGVTACNLLAFFLTTFINFTVYNTLYSLIGFILTNPNYYNVAP